VASSRFVTDWCHNSLFSLPIAPTYAFAMVTGTSALRVDSIIEEICDRILDECAGSLRCFKLSNSCMHTDILARCLRVCKQWFNIFACRLWRGYADFFDLITLVLFPPDDGSAVSMNLIIQLLD
jgi:hypothetical protein